MFIAYTTIHFSNNFVLPYQCLVTKFACAAGPKKAGCSCILRAQPNSKQNRRAEEQKRRTARKTIKLAKKNTILFRNMANIPSRLCYYFKTQRYSKENHEPGWFRQRCKYYNLEIQSNFLLLNFTDISNKFHLLSKRFLRAPQNESSRELELSFLWKKERSRMKGSSQKRNIIRKRALKGEKELSKDM